MSDAPAATERDPLLERAARVITEALALVAALARTIERSRQVRRESARLCGVEGHSPDPARIATSVDVSQILRQP